MIQVPEGRPRRASRFLIRALTAPTSRSMSAIADITTVGYRFSRCATSGVVRPRLHPPRKNPVQAKPGRGAVGNSDDHNAGTPALRNYSREAIRVSTVGDTFWARSSASALLSGRRYAILLP